MRFVIRPNVIPVLSLAGCLLLAGCGGNNDSPDKKGKTPPSSARGVLDIKAKGEDGAAVVVIGRVGGREKPLVPGRTAFTIVDTSFKPCNEREGDSCPTPWDYCCESAEDLKNGTLLVRLVDDDGNTVAKDAREHLGIEPLQTVIVEGTLKRGEGSFVLLAREVHIKK